MKISPLRGWSTTTRHLGSLLSSVILAGVMLSDASADSNGNQCYLGGLNGASVDCDASYPDVNHVESCGSSDADCPTNNYDSPYVVFQQGVPRVPAAANNQYCTLDGYPQFTGIRFIYPAYKETRSNLGALFPYYIANVGRQAVQLTCVVTQAGACEIRAGGQSAASACQVNPLHTCDCKNDVEPGTTQPNGKSIAQTKCAVKNAIGANASVNFAVALAGTANVTVTWNTLGGVSSNGAVWADSCSFRVLAQPPFVPVDSEVALAANGDAPLPLWAWFILGPFMATMSLYRRKAK